MRASRHRNNNKSLVWRCLLAALLLAGAISDGQTDFLRAKAFLKAAYPELKGKNLRVTVWDDASFDSDGGMTTFSIGLEKRIEDRPNNRTSFAPCLGAFFSFPVASDDRVFQLSVNGPCVNENKLEDTRKLVDAHTEWSDSQVIQALKDAGAEYGPDRKTAFLNLIHLHALEPSVGKLSLVSVDFQLRDKTQLEENLPAADLQWLIRAKARMPDEKHCSTTWCSNPLGVS
jgi:hypothetical protein